MMKKVNLILVICCIIGAAFATSCKDKDEAKPSKKSLLVGKKWKEIARTVSPAFDGETDAYSRDPACQRDNFFQFNSDGTFAYDEGPTKCDASDPQSINGTWAFNSDETVLNLAGNGNNTVYTILELTSTQFKYSFPIFHNGVTYTFVSTYTIQ